VTRLSNSFEGGSDGTSISAGNSGGVSGNAFDNVGGTTPTFSAAAGLFGSLGMACSVAAAAQSDVIWSTLNPTTFDTCSGRFYINQAAAPGVIVRLNRVRQAATQQWALAIDTSGFIRILDGANAALATGAVNVAGSPTRIEYQADRAAGAITVRIFKPHQASEPVETLSVTGQSIGASAWDDIRHGLVSSSTTYTVLMDSIEFAPAELVWIGPVMDLPWVPFPDPNTPLGLFLRALVPPVYPPPATEQLPIYQATDVWVNYGATGTSIAFTGLTGVVAGSCALVHIIREYAGSPTHPALAGWTEVSYKQQVQSDATLTDHTVLVHMASGSESGSYTFSWTGTTLHQGVLSRIEGVDPANPFEAFAHDAATVDGGATPAVNIDTLGINRLLIALGVGYGGATDYAITGGGWTTQETHANIIDATKPQLTAGNSGSTTVTSGNSDRKFIFLGALKPIPVGGPQTYPLSLAGTITPTGTAIKQTLKNLAASTTPAGVNTKQTLKLLAGSVTPSGALAVAKQYVRAFAGAITPTGTNTKQVNKNLAASTTPAGVVVKQANKGLAGALTPAATLIKRVDKLLAATTTPAGTLTKLALRVKAFAGSITPSGTLVKRVDKPLAGTVASSGSNTKQVNKNLGGASSPTGALAVLRLVVRSFAGTVTPAGSLIKTKLTSFTASLTPQGSLSKSSSKLFSGAVTPSGAGTYLRAVLRSFAGSITPSGLLSKSTLLRPSGSSSPTGTLLKQPSKKLAGSSSPSGSLTALRTVIRNFAAAITPSGSLTKQFQRLVGGTVTSTGSISKRVNKSFTASTVPSGNLSKSRTVLRSFSGTVTITGALSAQRISGIAFQVGVMLMARRWQATQAIRRSVEWVTRRTEATPELHAKVQWLERRTHAFLYTGSGGTLQEGQDITLPAQAVEYVWITVKSTADPTGGTVKVAMTEGDPIAGDFKTAEWVGTWNASTKQADARFLAGSATWPLVADKHYNVHIQVSAGLETPVIWAGQIHTT